MNFITISQYFNKLHSVLFALLIVPLIVFIARYVFGQLSADQDIKYFVIIPSFVLLDWLMATLIFNKKIKSARNAQGLGAKLDKYFHITIVRFCFLSLASLTMALGLHLTGSDVFMWLYLAGLIGSAFLWPSGRKVSADLRLKGDEREMVYYKKDRFE
jgi:hypothetical protein